MNDKIYKNIWKLYGYWFFHNLIFAYVIERLYWEQRGITIQQVVYTEIIYAGVVVLLEVPTGSLADFWSRKSMMILSAVCAFFEFLILIFAHSFWHFAAAVFIAAIGKAFSSGTSNALLYDSLKSSGKESEFEKFLGRCNFFDYSSGVIAALAGSIIASKYGYVYAYWSSLVCVSIAFFITLTLKEPKTRTTSEENKYFDYIKQAFGFIKGEKTIIFIVSLGIMVSSCLTYVDEFWQLYIKEIKIPVVYFGLVSAGGLFVRSIASVFAYKIKGRLSYKSVFSWLLILFISAILVSSFISTASGLIPLCLTFAFAGILEPLILGYMHHRTDSKIRATVESFQSLLLRAATIIIGLFFGYFSTKYTIFAGFRFLGLICLAYSLYYIIFQFRFIKE